MRTVGHVIAIAYWLAALGLLSRPLEGLLFLVIANHIISHIVFLYARGTRSLAVALAALVLFDLGSILAFLLITMHPGGPDGGMAVLAISIYSFPVLLPFWLAAIILARRTPKIA